ncbi:MAG: tRNA pseudouridine(55) synthase TruB [Clostridia bacterium]|nr:tRNA pseudouridine(55) synthase TruB [Clostridia bacterium]
MNFNGIILVDKEAGMTSFSVDSCIRKMCNTRKVGHSGTLDPFATGLLPVFVGDGLRFVRYTDNYDKAYRATAVLGISTDTMDCDGEILSRHDMNNGEICRLLDNDGSEVRKAFDEIVKCELQMPPKYSAKKINGQKAYDLARAGVEFELKPNKIKIYSIDIHSIKEETVYFKDEIFNSIVIDFTVSCSKGTYIRTICDDLGRILGTGAYCNKLRRLKCGSFDVSDAKRIDELKSLSEQELSSTMLQGDKALSFMPKLELNEVQFSMVKVGKKLKAAAFGKLINRENPDIRYRAVYQGKTVAVVYYSEEETDEGLKQLLRIERMLWK